MKNNGLWWKTPLILVVLYSLYWAVLGAVQIGRTQEIVNNHEKRLTKLEDKLEKIDDISNKLDKVLLKLGSKR